MAQQLDDAVLMDFWPISGSRNGEQTASLDLVVDTTPKDTLVDILQSRHGIPIFSFILCLGGIFAFVIHTYFLKKGRTEFDRPLSKIILWLTLLVSVVQLAVTIFLMSAS